MHKIQNEHPEADKVGHSSRSMGSFTWHQVSILPHSNYKETPLLPSLPVERQSLPIQDLALQSIHCSQDLCKGHEAHSSSMSHDGNNNISIPGWCTSAIKLLHSSQEDGLRVVQLLHKLGFVLSLEKYQLEPTQEFTHWDLVFNTQDMTFHFPRTSS